MLQPLVVGLACALVALIVIRAYAAHVYGAYLENGAFGRMEVLLLSRRLVAEFLGFAAIVVLLWGQRRQGRFAAGVGVLIFATTQFAQFTSAAISDDLITPEVLGMLELYESVVSLAQVLKLGALLALLIPIFWWLMRALHIESVSLPVRGAAAALLLLPAFLLAGPYRLHREEALARRYGLTSHSPTIELGLAWWKYLTAAPAAPNELSAEDLALARSYGIDLDPERLTPTFRATLFHKPFPFAPKADVDQPHVIILFLESLSAGLIEPYGGGRPGLTPHLQDMARVSMRVDKYYNHTFPTLRGLRGQLCSSFPAHGHEAWRDSVAKIRTGRLLCLPHLLAREGYHTVYLTHELRTAAYLESQIIDFGFHEGHYRHDIIERLLPGDRMRSSGQPSDWQMFRALVSYLEGWDPQQPLLVALSTIGTHIGWDAPEDGLRFGDGSNRVLNTIHSLDHGFGSFWEWFKTSPFAGRTIVVVTGDHVIAPHDMARRAAPQFPFDSTLAPMALLIHDPTHELPPVFEACTSSIDLAPSLLQLLHWKNQPNPFIGLSFFSDRAMYRGGPGLLQGDALLAWEEGEPRIHRMEALECDDAGPRNHPCSLLRILQYLHGLESSNRLWRD